MNTPESQSVLSPNADQSLSACSFYEPSTFCIFFRPGVLDENGRLQKKGIPTFVHEYAHLIQDRTCLHGVFQTLLWFDALAGTAKVVERESANGQLRVPLTESAHFDESWLHGAMNLQVTFGRSPAWDTKVNWAYSSFRLVERSIYVQGRYEAAAQVLVEWVNNETEETYQRVLGPRELKEAYAVAVELIHGGGEVTTADQFEYLAVERMLLKELVNVSPEQIVAVCHWALQCPTPAIRLVQIIHFLKSTQSAHGSLQAAPALFDTLRKHTQTEWLHDEFVEDVLGQLSELETLQAEVGQTNLLYSAIRWYCATARELLSLSSGKSRFPMDTFLCDRSKDFTALRDSVPVPVVAFPEGPPISFGATELASDTALFMCAMVNLVNNLAFSRQPSWPCPMYNACASKSKGEDCRSRPWTRQGCPYGAAAAYCGVSGCEIIGSAATEST